MQYQFFVIPAKDDSIATEELNKFLRSHRILSVQREFVSQSDNSYWAVAVEFLEQATGYNSGKSRIDYKEILSADDFHLYTRLREVRKEIAHEEGVPPYTVFTNEQLAGLVQNRAKTKADMGRINGIGEAKIVKYAPRFLEVLNEEHQSPV